jgi:beta-lactam-binding protein with PASTA domain
MNIPNLIGMNYLEATAALIASGFTVGRTVEVKIRSGNNSTVGSVIGQSPAAGIDTTLGTAVSLTVNKPFGQFPASEQNAPIPYWYFLTR